MSNLQALNFDFKEGEENMVRTVFKPTEGKKCLVQGLARRWIRPEDIASWLDLCSPKTMRKHFREELDRGRIAADFEILKNAYKMATAGTCLSATIYYVNRRAARRAHLAPGTNPVPAPDFVVIHAKEAA